MGKSWKEKLGYVKEVLDIIRDKVPNREKFGFLFEPANVKTASRLNVSQVNFMADAHLAESFYAEFEPLRKLAEDLGESTVSEGGKGRQEAIAYEQATQQVTGATQLGVFQTTGKNGKQKKEKVKDAKTE